MTSLLLVVLAAAYLAACLGLFLVQRRLQYFPQPRRLGPTLLAERFERGDAVLQLTVRPHPGRGAVLYFGGNGEDVSGALGPLAAAFPDREIVMLHYRGYGGSTGAPTEAAITGDAAALFDRVHAQRPDVVVVGRSLGSGVAVRLASTRPVAGVVLVTPYDSLVGIAQASFRWFPVRWLLVDKYESWRYVPQVRAPVLVLQAQRDELIPAGSTQRLLARFRPGQARFVEVPLASHNTICDDPLYVSAMQEFGAALVAPAAGPASGAPPVGAVAAHARHDGAWASDPRGR